MTDTRPQPIDQPQRISALDTAACVLVEAPAGSGKTDLLTRRFLALLAEVEDPQQIVAITFTRAAAAEMRHRILSELERACTADEGTNDAFAMHTLARRAVEHSQRCGWQLLELPTQLRITTIDAFCRSLAQQQPLLNGMGNNLELAEQPDELYRQAARATLEQLDEQTTDVARAVEQLLRWRDNNWSDLEALIVEMLGARERWMQDFVLDRAVDWDELRHKLEAPMLAALRTYLLELEELVDQVPAARETLHQMAALAYANSEGQKQATLAQMDAFPEAYDASADELSQLLQVWHELNSLLRTGKGEWKSKHDARDGFPPALREAKQRLASLIAGLGAVEGLSAHLDLLALQPDAGYEEEEWRIVQACFVVLRQAAAHLQIAFNEAGRVDFTQIAQMARLVLASEGEPSDAALAAADGIRHLLIDEFQDTSRSQYLLLQQLLGAWPEREGRTCFAVGDPMQSIYLFRGADVELFLRLKHEGLATPYDEPLVFRHAPLGANFRTAPTLVESINAFFAALDARADGSGIHFHRATPARPVEHDAAIETHLRFMPARQVAGTEEGLARRMRIEAKAAELDEIVGLIAAEAPRIAAAAAEGRRHRVAVLGRTVSVLRPIAAALREAGIGFRAIGLERLMDRPEVQDALQLARALLVPLDRVAWISVLRAPWCGLTLAQLHLLVSDDDKQLQRRAIPELLEERAALLTGEARIAVEHLQRVAERALELRRMQPENALGTWLEQVWSMLGGAQTVDATGAANLQLLWQKLDQLPQCEQDLLGPNLTAALDKLTALPDPTVSEQAGVQLMTIHKSKGLEFEVVVLPDMQAMGKETQSDMLLWLERGLDSNELGEDLTEFLIAPLAGKGGQSGKAKNWVGQQIRRREQQEMRRLLYVAMTRARERLHLFALVRTHEKEGEVEIEVPRKGLLATAWPALESLATARFKEWSAEQTTTPREIASLAASTDAAVIEFPKQTPRKPGVIRRLSAALLPEVRSGSAESNAQLAVGSEDALLYARHEGGIESRTLGNMVHELLEEYALQRVRGTAETARAAMQARRQRCLSLARAVGLQMQTAEEMIAQAMEMATASTYDAKGAWLLEPHADASSESAWTGMVRGQLRNVRVDRLFRAGARPLSDDQTHWWIVDYKTAHVEAGTLEELRKTFQPQLHSYAEILRALHGQAVQIRCALFYPRSQQFDWWTPPQ